MQSGELIVTGKDEVRIHLQSHHYPSKVKVWFHDEICIVPCNPHHADSLEWDLQQIHSHHGIVLVIKWNVSGVREIKWSAHY